MSETSNTIPDGFERHFRQSPATDPWEPLWSRRGDGCFVLGLYVAHQHCNARGLLHGGVISSLADNAMGLSCVMELGGKVSLVTVTLSVDFLGIAPIGTWLEFMGMPTKLGKTLCFAAARISADGIQIATANAVFRTVPTNKAIVKGLSNEQF
jgi:uncharacterized protein (TIGR00369 family)